ncbi:hypothetical protein cypCar_00017550 [Cyprinus carpio]|nr:hypothetical protein cypCar_00017550 [Cyprinus carpio]
MTGVPGVRPERFEEGLTVKHCALSLLGEPIMYPDINSFLRLLHQQNISSFLVTNAQFPEEIRWDLKALGEASLSYYWNPKNFLLILFQENKDLPDLQHTPYEIFPGPKHSPFIRSALDEFKVDGEWWTWIDYECFQELIKGYEESGGTKSFSAMDYMAKTPSWAIFGARERGFDPSDTRFQRKNKTKDISGC